MKTFSENELRIKIREMKSEGITTVELSRRSGVPQPCISRFLGGKTITVATLEKLWPFLYGDTPQQRASGE